MAADDPHNNHPQPGNDPDADPSDDFDGEHPYASGINGLLEAVANVVEKERFVDAISGWVDSQSQKVKSDGEKAKIEEHNRWHAYWMSLVFSLAIFGGLSVLTWNDKITKETAGVLFGSLIGYWFGRQQKKGE